MQESTYLVSSYATALTFRSHKYLIDLACCVLLFLLLLSPFASAADRPNILWLTCEDNNVNWVGCYGNPYAETPNIDKLATEGF